MISVLVADDRPIEIAAERRSALDEFVRDADRAEFSVEIGDAVMRRRRRDRQRSVEFGALDERCRGEQLEAAVEDPDRDVGESGAR